MHIIPEGKYNIFVKSPQTPQFNSSFKNRKNKYSRRHLRNESHKSLEKFTTSF